MLSFVIKDVTVSAVTCISDTMVTHFLHKGHSEDKHLIGVKFSISKIVWSSSMYAFKYVN